MLAFVVLGLVSSIPDWLERTSLKLNDCIMWNAHNTLFGSKRSAICAQAVTSYIWQCLVSRACDWVMSALSAVLLIYSFQFRPAFLPRRSARWHSGILGLANIGHRMAPKIWGGFLHGAYRPAEWLWIDSNGKDGK